MKVLVTGASGLLGTKLTQLALESNHTVASGYSQHSPRYGTPLHLDVTDEAEVEKCISSGRPDVVFNLASMTDVDLCGDQPELAMRINGDAVGFIARACSKTGTLLIHVSTDYVFDGERGGYREDDATAPVNVYGKSKLLGEMELQKHAHSYLIARTSVVYGWGRQHRPNFATWLITKLRAGESVKVVKDQFSSPTLNTHLARMLLEASERKLTGIIHMAGATRISRFDFAVTLSRIFRFDTALLTPAYSDSISWKARRPRDSSLDVTKASNILDNKPTGIEEALEEFAKETSR